MQLPHTVISNSEKLTHPNVHVLVRVHVHNFIHVHVLVYFHDPVQCTYHVLLHVHDLTLVHGIERCTCSCPCTCSCLCKCSLPLCIFMFLDMLHVLEHIMSLYMNMFSCQVLSGLPFETEILLSFFVLFLKKKVCIGKIVRARYSRI